MLGSLFGVDFTILRRNFSPSRKKKLITFFHFLGFPFPACNKEVSFALTFRFWFRYSERLYLGDINIVGGLTQLESDTHRSPCRRIYIIYIYRHHYLTDKKDAFHQAVHSTKSIKHGKEFNLPSLSFSFRQ